MESEASIYLNILKKDGPRWLVLLIDLFLVWCSFVVSYILVLKHCGEISLSVLLFESIIISLFYLIAFLIFKPYQSIVRRTGLRDLKLIGNCIAVAFLIAIILSYLWEFIVSKDIENQFYVSQTQLLLHVLLPVIAVKEISKTNFIVTRFGNVLGSNGSVIPLFEKQIDKGGPITITHPDITRFFMTIPEACQLVRKAGVMGQGGEIYVFDMGESVKIMDLAKQMIRLKGLSYP